MGISLNNFLNGVISREIKKLYLSFLYSIEDLKTQNIITE
jgi:hypothetical protein